MEHKVDEILTIKLQYRPQDLQNAYTAHWKKFTKFRYYFSPTLAGIFLLLGGALLAMNSEKPFWGALFVFYGLLLLAFFYFRTQRLGKQYYKKLPYLQHPLTYKLSPAGVTVEGKNIMNKNTWATYSKALITRQIILLYSSELTFSFFPKAILKTQDFDAIKSYIKEHINNIYYA